MMAIPPRTYSEWTDALTELKTGMNDEEILAALYNGSIEWQGGVADRLVDRLMDVVNTRMNRAVDKLQKNLSRANGQESVAVQSLLSLRKEFVFLIRVVNIPSVPQAIREQMEGLVRKQADSIQSSLEKSAAGDRSGRLLSLIKHNRVNSLD